MTANATINGNIAVSIGTNFWQGADFLGSDWYAENRPAGDTGDGTLGYYLPANVTFDAPSQCTKITAKVQAQGGRAYTSGQLQMSFKNYTFGTFELRCKFPACPPGSGLTAAFWLLGANCQQTLKFTEDNVGICQWPDTGSGEMDLAEILVSDGNQFNMQLHTDTSSAQIIFNHGTSLSDAFHVYKFIWAPGSLQGFFDGASIGTITDAAVPNYPMFVILGFSVGPLGASVNNANLPQDWFIDYLKVTP